MKHLLEVHNLVTRFYTEDDIIYAVNSISYTLDEGESMAIVGESGSGKSVSVLSMLDLIPSPPGKVESGQVILNGRDILKISPEEMRRVRGCEIAMIFQDPMTSLNPVLTIGRQLTEALEIHLGMTREQANERADEMLTMVGIPNALDRLNDYPYQFSGGQRQRVGIAMALSRIPSLLIADEPTTALDVTIQAQIIDMVKQLREKLGMTIIWITHDLGIVAGLVEKVAVMYAGFIVEMAPVRELFKESSHPYTLGLLESLPSIDTLEKKRLTTIPGLPPDQSIEPTCCPFAARCRYIIARCWRENPTLRPVSQDHYAACWRAKEVYEGLRILADQGEAIA